LLAFAGRLVPEKGLETLLRAAASLPRVRVEIAGGGPLRAAWADLARELGLAQRVRFVGELTPDGVRDLYSRADIVCVPSIWGEPFGYSAAEAMAMGRPVAASDCGALPELVGDGRGWLCRAGDPEDWAAKLTQALGNPGERQRRGSRAREFACTRLAPAHVARQYVSVYESVLGAAGTPHHHAGRA
jgi:glycosyltransferase involved in cell wall biosynthesis